MAPGRWRPRQRKQVRESRIHSHPLSPSPVLSLSIRARSPSFRLPSDVGLLWAGECARENRVREHHEFVRHSIADEGAPSLKSSFEIISPSTHEAKSTSPCVNKFFLFSNGLSFMGASSLKGEIAWTVFQLYRIAQRVVEGTVELRDGRTHLRHIIE